MRHVAGYSCIRCGNLYPNDLPIDSRGCPSCFEEAPSNLQVIYGSADGGGPRRSRTRSAMLPSLWRYADMLPCGEDDAVSLGEGLTPLLATSTIGEKLGVPNLLIKDEGRNPTWSHKDRFSTVAVSAARLQGARVVATASSGNAGASLAAYASAAGLRCVVATFPGTSGPMLAQIRKYGAMVVVLSAKTDRWSFLAEGVARFGWFAASPFHAPVVGSHPVGIEGYKTIAYEIVEQINDVPDWCAIPVCYGDALVGIWKGFQELLKSRKIDRLPRLLAAEVHGSLATALEENVDVIPDAVASFSTLAVSIGTTRSTFQALRALRESEGAAVAVSNLGLIELQEELASSEGLLAELASVTPFAAIGALRKRDIIRRSDRVVAVVTASGLKDVDRSTGQEEQLPIFRSVSDAWAFIRSDKTLQPEC
jgi:threonine synthase